MICNRMFQRDFQSSCTFRGHQSCTQVGYILLHQEFSKHLVHCGIEARLDIGSDPRAVAATLEFVIAKVERIPRNIAVVPTVGFYPR